jgi:structural maintenance of chromosome 2
VRATNLQELIYKGGNAGITKATVSIIFDNSDKDQSPPGYQEYEEIFVTRQVNKIQNRQMFLFFLYLI